jgi:integrase
MASIEKRVRNGTVSYRARYRDPAGRQRVKTFRRKVDAEKYLALIEAAKLRGTWTDPAHGKITLAEWLETWWGSAADLRPSTVARDRAYLNSLVLPRFGTTQLAAITQPDVQAWVAQLTARGFAPATVVKAYQLLGRTLTAAVNADLIPRSPCRAVRLPKIEREEMRFLNPAEVARLADAIGPRYRALVLLGAYGGLRMGELAGLRRGRVDLLRGTVDVAEIVVEVHGQLYTGPPKGRAPQRRAAARRDGGAGRPHGAGRPSRRPRVHRREGRRAANFELPHQGVASCRALSWPGAAAPARPSPHRGRVVDRGRRQPQRGQRPSRAHLRQLHTGPLRPPAPRPRRRAARAPGRHARPRPASGDQPAGD